MREARRALLQERVENHTVLAEQTRAWHWWVAELQNNLTVLRYLQQHPGTPQERLTGVLVWRAGSHSRPQRGMRPARAASSPSCRARRSRRAATCTADPSLLTPAQVSDEIHPVQVALLRVSLLGDQMLKLSAEFRDFPPSVSEAEWLRLNNAPDAHSRQRLAPARALTDERLRAAGYAPLNDTRK